MKQGLDRFHLIVFDIIDDSFDSVTFNLCAYLLSRTPLVPYHSLHRWFDISMDDVQYSDDKKDHDHCYSCYVSHGFLLSKEKNPYLLHSPLTTLRTRVVCAKLRP
jgi:hypothetical protein